MKYTDIPKMIIKKYDIENHQDCIIVHKPYPISILKPFEVDINSLDVGIKNKNVHVSLWKKILRTHTTQLH